MALFKNALPKAKAPISVLVTAEKSGGNTNTNTVSVKLKNARVECPRCNWALNQGDASTQCLNVHCPSYGVNYEAVPSTLTLKAL